MGSYDDIPEWIKTVTFRDEFEMMPIQDVLDKYNYLKGAYWGFELKIKQLEKELAEANEKFDLSRDYQRQLDIQALEEVYNSMSPTAVANRMGLRQGINKLKEQKG